MATTDFFLILDGIKGETADKQMKDKAAIDIDSFSWGLANDGSFQSIGGGGTGKSSFSDISFMKSVDKSSPALAQHCSTGKHVTKATVHARKAGEGQKEYYTITLEDCMVSSFQTSASGPIITESFSLNFAKIKWEYKTQDAKGAMVAGGDFKYDVKASSA